jgi:hypothetical protein
MKNFKTVLISALICVYLLAISALLTLAIGQAIRLISLYRVSAVPSSGTGVSNLQRLSISLGNDALILAIVAVVLFIFVFRKPRRLLPVSIMAALVFVTLNLYSGRHVLPQVLVWPSPVSLLEQYTQALASNDLEAVLSLTDRSDVCETIMMQVFQDDQALVKQRLGDDWHEMRIKSISVERITTFYDKPVPQGFVVMQPVPSQLVFTVIAMENGKTVILHLKMRYTPFLGTRYICGQGIDD